MARKEGVTRVIDGDTFEVSRQSVDKAMREKI